MPVKLNKIPIEDFGSNLGITWATHLNDFRPESRNTNPHHPQTLLHELVFLMLFCGENVLLPDAHITCCPSFQHLFQENDLVKNAFRQGNLVLAIRDNAGNLDEVNNKQKSMRKHKEDFECSKAFAPIFDKYIGSETRCAEYKISDLSKSFSDGVQKIIESNLITNLQDRDILCQAAAQAYQKEGGEDVFRYGKVVEYLDEHYKEKAERLKSYFNPAYLLSPLFAMDYLPFSLHWNIPHSKYASILLEDGGNQKCLTDTDNEGVPEDLWKVHSLNPSELSHECLCECQKIAQEMNYYDALRSARVFLRTSEEKEEIRNFQNVLLEYMMEIKKVTRCGEYSWTDCAKKLWGDVYEEPDFLKRALPCIVAAEAQSVVHTLEMTGSMILLPSEIPQLRPQANGTYQFGLRK